MRFSIAVMAVMGMLGLCRFAWADEIEDRFEKKVFTTKDGGTMNYRLLAPVAPKAGEKYPLVIFLHGGGERGDDNTLQLLHGVKRFAQDDFLKQYPCYVIAPQCPKELIWASRKFSEEAAYEEEPSVPTKMLMELIDSLETTLAIDTHREYVTGLSMGGFGSWDMAMRQPHRFAAIAPVCAAGSDFSRMASIKHLPVWVFHGGADTDVKVERTLKALAALKAAGGNPVYTEYPGVGHNCWYQAYSEPKFYEWLFAQKNENPAK